MKKWKILFFDGEYSTEMTVMGEDECLHLADRIIMVDHVLIWLPCDTRQANIKIILID
jgi:hypothetical protein